MTNALLVRKIPGSWAHTPSLKNWVAGFDIYISMKWKAVSKRAYDKKKSIYKWDQQKCRQTVFSADVEFFSCMLWSCFVHVFIIKRGIYRLRVGCLKIRDTLGVNPQ